ncbi:hypothetical protein [Nocardia beijingensis]
MSYGRVFGGQLLGQFVRAATADSRQVDQVHAHGVRARGPHRRADPLGRSEGYAELAVAIIENDYLNGEVIRLAFRRNSPPDPPATRDDPLRRGTIPLVLH